MNFFQSIRTCFGKYFDFSGRAMRSEFWWFQLVLIALPIAMMAVDSLLLGYSWENTITPFAFGAEVLTVFPAAAVTSRRLHDIGRSGWWQLPIYLSYIIYFDAFSRGFSDSTLGGALIITTALYTLGLLIVLIRDSQPQTNQYGPSPKSEDQADVFI